MDALGAFVEQEVVVGELSNGSLSRAWCKVCEVAIKLVGGIEAIEELDVFGWRDKDVGMLAQALEDPTRASLGRTDIEEGRFDDPMSLLYSRSRTSQ